MNKITSRQARAEEDPPDMPEGVLATSRLRTSSSLMMPVVAHRYPDHLLTTIFAFGVHSFAVRSTTTTTRTQLPRLAAASAETGNPRTKRDARARLLNGWRSLLLSVSPLEGKAKLVLKGDAGAAERAGGAGARQA